MVCKNRGLFEPTSPCIAFHIVLIPITCTCSHPQAPTLPPPPPQILILYLSVFIIPLCSLCPRIANYTADFKHSSNWTSHYTSVTEPLLAQVKSVTNFAVDEDDLDHFCDCLRTHYCHRLGWPQGMNSSIYNALWTELTWQAYSQFKHPTVEENAQAGIGHLLRELWQVSSN